MPKFTWLEFPNTARRRNKLVLRPFNPSGSLRAEATDTSPEGLIACWSAWLAEARELLESDAGADPSLAQPPPTQIVVKRNFDNPTSNLIGFAKVSEKFRKKSRLDVYEQAKRPELARLVLKDCHFDRLAFDLNFRGVLFEADEAETAAGIDRCHFGEQTRPGGERVRRREIRGTAFHKTPLSSCVFQNLLLDGVIFNALMTGCVFEDSTIQDLTFTTGIGPVEFARCTFKPKSLTILGDSPRISGATFVDCTFTDVPFRRYQLAHVRIASMRNETDRHDVPHGGLTECDFDTACFTEGAKLENLTVTNCRFSATRFEHMEIHNVTFVNCQFHSATLSDVRLYGLVKFQRCTIQECAFEDVSLAVGCSVLLDGGRFSGNDIKRRIDPASEQTGEQFKPLTLLCCSFSNVEIQNVRFESIGFSEEQLRRGAGKFACFDDLDARTCGDTAEKHKRLEQASKLYGQLYRICLEEAHPSVAGECYYRMMQCRKMTAPKWGKPWHVLADTLCGYGERISRIASIFCIVLFGWALIYLLNGLSTNDGMFSYVVVSRWRAAEAADEARRAGFDVWALSPGQFASDFIDALRLSAAVFTNMGVEDIRPMNKTGAMLMSIESFLGIFTTALFVSVFFRKVAR